VYRGFDDLTAKIRHLLVDPQRAETIRQAGFRRARKEHTWEMRFERVFSLMNLIGVR
jgi:spore maturation protein CgeB